MSERRRQTYQEHFLEYELKLAVSLIEDGLAALQHSRSYMAPSKRFTYMLLLSTGFERFMKVIICLHIFERTGQFPSEKSLRGKFGHKLENLRDEIVERCYTVEYLKKPFARADLDFIVHNDVFTQMLDLFSRFARMDRYFYLDSAIGSSDREWPERQWEELEKATMPDELYELLVRENRLDELKSYANSNLVASAERFLRALARLFAHDGLGDRAKRCTGTLWMFLTIKDHELGKREYGQYSSA